jgi:flagella basal body P-ring formation protein FlgA
MHGALFLLLLLMGSHAVAADGEVRVAADSSVEHATIRLGEIASFEGLSDERLEQLEALSFGQAAPPARFRTLAGDAIREEIRRADPDVRAVVPPQVRVHTAYRQVRTEDLKRKLEQAIRFRMPWDPDVVQLANWSLPNAFPAPAHSSRTEIRFRRDEDFLGRVAATVTVFDPSDPSRGRVERSATVEVGVRIPVVVAAAPLRRGKTVDGDSVKLEERDLQALPGGVLTNLADVIGKRMNTAVGPGAPIFRRSLQLEKLVKRGDRISVEAEAPGLALKVDARALEHGVLGQTIRVENPISRSRFLVQITGERQARVPLPGVGTGP